MKFRMKFRATVGGLLLLAVVAALLAWVGGFVPHWVPGGLAVTWLIYFLARLFLILRAISKSMPK